ncbi:MAG: MarC family protein [Thermodesulfovibrionales bacterium]
MVASVVAFLVLLNPFALFIYLQPVMKALPGRDFRKVLLRASLTSLIIFFFFSFSGEFIFRSVLQIDFEAFRIFGGIVFFSFAYMYILHGRKSLINLKENLGDLANEIALPFMVGAGTILLSILMGHKFPTFVSFGLLALIMAANYLMIVALMYVRETLSSKLKVAFDKHMEMLLRLNGFFVGAIGLNMVITGINNLYFQ